MNAPGFLDPVEILTRSAELALARADWNAAFRQAQAALELDGNHVPALYVRAECAFQKNEIDAAIVDVTTALIFLPTEPNLWLARARYQTNCNSSAALLDVFECMKLQPEHPWARLISARIRLDANRLEEVKTDLDWYDQHATPHFVQLQLLRAQYYYAKKQYEPALKHLNEILKVNPDHGDALVLSAMIQSESNQNALAIQSLTAALKERPKDAQIWLRRGKIMYLLLRLPDAIADLTMALTLYPTLAEALLVRGFILRDVNDLPNALRDLTAYLKVEPNSGQAYLGRASVYAGLGDKDAARSDLQMVRKLMPAGFQLPPELVALFEQV